MATAVNICLHFKLGHCKYQDTCTLQHIKELCENRECDIKFEEKLKRNVLEIKVEKDNAEDEMIMSEDIIANLLCKLNINIKLHVEGYLAQMNMKIL